ncbi:MAG: hypothetical protein RML72_10765 [Bacteroidia bacterium]|nr:hypothetical protein [Bacteroidia bacterium]
MSTSFAYCLGQYGTTRPYKTLTNAFLEIPITFNLMVGEDASRLATTTQGFGSISGLVLIDNIHLRSKVLFRTSNQTGFFVSSGIGFIAKKYRFAENLVFENRNNQLVFYPDPNPNHQYSTNFFSYSKSKLVLTYFRIPLAIGFSVLNYTTKKEHLNISTGVIFDVLTGAKHKLKYTEDGEDKMDVLRTNSNIHASPFQLGVQARIEMFNGLGLYGAYMLTPMFQENKGPRTNALEVAIYYAAKIFD